MHAPTRPSASPPSSLAASSTGLTAADLRGVFVPLVTPFTPNGELDTASFSQLAAWLLDAGVDGFVLAGTTGESPTLRWPEVERLLAILRGLVRGRVPILVGTGSADTAASITCTERARAGGADGAFVVVPPYSRPAAAGVIEHFRRIAAVGLPTVAYNIPYRTGLVLDLDTLAAILALPGVVGMKESSGGLANIAALAPRSRAALLGGEDLLFVGALAAGATGGILAAANLVPAALLAAHRAWLAGRPLAARVASARVRALVAALFAEPNPAPLKWALARQGRIAHSTQRLPLVPISEALGQHLAALLTPPSARATAADTPSDGELAALAGRFARQEIPAAAWSHREHLLLAAWHVGEHGPDEALVRLRDGIRRLNQAHGTPETPTRGYHETITRAYVELVAALLAELPAGAAPALRAGVLLASPLAHPEALFTYYDRERLLSPAARAAFVEPDRPFDLTALV